MYRLYSHMRITSERNTRVSVNTRSHITKVNVALGISLNNTNLIPVLYSEIQYNIIRHGMNSFTI